jgi:hypothetical protein
MEKKVKRKKTSREGYSLLPVSITNHFGSRSSNDKRPTVDAIAEIIVSPYGKKISKHSLFKYISRQYRCPLWVQKELNRILNNK